MTEAIELHHTLTGDTLRYAGNNTPSGLYKLLIPAGTSAWRVGVQTYRVDEVAIAVMRMDAPPVAAHSAPLDDTRRTLQRLWSGETLRAESPGNSGTLMISQPETGDPWRADRDRWLYIDVQFPAGRTLAWQSQVVLSEAPAPAIDPALLERTRQYVNASGYTDAVRAFGGFGPGQDGALVAKATACGLVKALTEMVRLAEGGR